LTRKLKFQRVEEERALRVRAENSSNELSLKKDTWSSFSLWIKKKREEKAGRVNGLKARVH